MDNKVIYNHNKFTISPYSISTPSKAPSSGGFALVIALGLMSFVLVLLLTITTLVQVEQASSATSVSKMKADQAALLSLNMAIGKLQETAGLDQRVTAPAESVATVNGSKQLTGVWRSWEGKDHNQTNGMPIAPNYRSKLSTGELDINSTQDGRFLGWLVSSEFDPSKTTTSSAGSPPNLVETDATVKLVADGSVDSGEAGDEEDEVHVVPTELDDGSTAIAWWISGENTKALMYENPDVPSENGVWSQRLASNGRADSMGVGFSDDSEVAKLTSRESMELATNSNFPVGGEETVTEELFHDLTSYSYGLLTNTANGGWKRDLSLMAETWHDQSSGGDVVDSSFVPGDVFSLTPERKKEASLTLEDSPSDAAIYPWVSDKESSMSWNALADFTALYKRVKSNAGKPFFTAHTHLGSDRITIDPILARLHWTFGFAARLAAGSTDEYQPMLAYKPSVTVWNPYNVAIEAPQSFELGMARFESNPGYTHFPLQFTFTLDGTTSYTPSLGPLLGNHRNAVRRARMSTQLSSSNDQTWRPGESRVFGLSNSDFDDAEGNAVVYMDPGLNTRGANKRPLNHRAIGTTDNQGMTGSGASPYTVSWDWNADSDENIDAWCNLKPNRQTRGEGELDTGINTEVLLRTFSSLTDAENTIPLPDVQNVDETLASAAAEESPFLNVLLTLRMPSETSVPTKGYINTKPLVSRSHGMAGDTTFNQSSYEWLFIPSATWDGPGTPESDPNGAPGADHSGYVGNSFESIGAPNWSIAELPTQPLQSLGELQHFDAAYNNALAPRVANAIGNSHATPDIASNQVERLTASGSGYDHSYVGNHIFFDDWFVSSLTPDVAPYSSVVERSIEQVYADHLSNEEPLRNYFYRPATTLETAEAVSLATAFLTSPGAWRTIASELEVQGMFNINSTSEVAWAALLKNQRNVSVSEIDIGGDGTDDWSLGLKTTSDFPVSRTTIASDPNTAISPAASQLSEFSTLTDAQIDELAVQIVEQIKQRGPFLSLSEFMNRQLSSDDDLALAGTIESALIELSKQSGAKNPFSDLQSEFPMNAEAGPGAVFGKAAEGSVAYGAPGWIRQADIIRPIAPVLSARDDTFTIRAYGESRNEVTGEVTSRSWCEAIVQRRADYVDPLNVSTVEYSDLSNVNKAFGRGFKIVSLRWLSPDEV
ncbi:MAG: hypothetical protein ACSHYA_07610 [Opitutaceae bacterium]